MFIASLSKIAQEKNLSRKNEKKFFLFRSLWLPGSRSKSAGCSGIRISEPGEAGTGDKKIRRNALQKKFCGNFSRMETGFRVSDFRLNPAEAENQSKQTLSAVDEEDTSRHGGVARQHEAGICKVLRIDRSSQRKGFQSFFHFQMLESGRWKNRSGS